MRFLNPNVKLVDEYNVEVVFLSSMCTEGTKVRIFYDHRH